jgi:hypothetical protein
MSRRRKFGPTPLYIEAEEELDRQLADLDRAIRDGKFGGGSVSDRQIGLEDRRHPEAAVTVPSQYFSRRRARHD